MPHSDRLNIAVFIDFDNIEIGVKNTLHEPFDVGTVLDAIKERGEVVTKIAYADWTRASDYSRHLTQHAIRLVQRNLTPGGDKNGADINLALDALEMAFTHPHINAYVIVSGDSDFLSLVEKLKQYDKKVFVVGGRAFTSIILQKNCHEFIAYENLRPRRSSAPAKDGRQQTPIAASSSPIAQAFPIVRRALKILADREVTPQTGLLKSTLLQLDSTFSERNYGASSFLDFAEKLAQAGVVTLKHAGRSVMVELTAGAAEDGGAEAIETRIRTTDGDDGAGVTDLPVATVAQAPAVAATESQEAGVARAGGLLAAATSARWPMYIRNVKQILRQAPGGFDERTYGFGGLIDLIKALQKDGVLRMERDRRGGLRVFKGAKLQTPGVAQDAPTNGNVVDVAFSDADSGPQPGNIAEPYNRADVEPQFVEPVDTTAELLGRRSRKPRARTPRLDAAPAAKKIAKKAAPRRSSRGKKSPASEASDTSDE